MTTLSPAPTPAPTSAVDILKRHDDVRTVLSKQLFFVVGCQKSGTTWVQRILDGHPQAICRGEAAFGPIYVPVMKQLADTWNQQQHYRNAQLRELPDEDLMDNPTAEYFFANGVGMMMARWPGALDEATQAIGEKTPEHAMFLPLLHRVFPRLKVIHITRDPRDACLSGWHHNVRTHGEAKLRQQFANQAAYAEYFVQRHWLSYGDTVRAFAKREPDAVIDVRYEDLHTQPDVCVEAMLSHLDLDTTHVEACVQAGSFKTLTQGRERGSEDKQSFFRKGITGEGRKELEPAALDVILKHAGQRMRDLGYDA